MPKFRGGSDDWLDDEDSRAKSSAGSRRAKKSGRSHAGVLPYEEANATVAEVFQNQCRARLDEDGAEILSSYRRAQVISKNPEEPRERTPVAVGDRVLVARVGGAESQDGIVEGICARRNFLARPAPGRDGTMIQHVIAANLDLFVIVASVSSPDYSPGLIDRYLVASQAAMIPALIVVNKIDLLPESTDRPWLIYRDLGYEVVELSAKKKLRLDELQARLRAQARVKDKTTIAFAGKSGVGKTSLLRALLEIELGKVGEVSESTGKGRHTTTGAILLQSPLKSESAAFAPWPEEFQWIDTPGVREFGLTSVTPEKLALYFPELRALHCPQPGCQHIDEEGCLARALPRYESYRRIWESLSAGEN